MNCEQCRGRCCGLFFLPEFVTLRVMREVGVQFDGVSDLYVSLHPGLTRRGDFWYLDADAPIAQYRGRLGRRWVIDAPCAWLTAQGRCGHYADRPVECRAMDERTVSAFFVPKGCCYDVSRAYGEDMGEVIRHGERRDEGAGVGTAGAGVHG